MPAGGWRRERDSNPRYTFWAYTRFPVVLLQPLGHLSARCFKTVCHMRQKVAERVGFEPTCPAIHRTTRFRVEPVTATSVPLRNCNHLFTAMWGEKSNTDFTVSAKRIQTAFGQTPRIVHPRALRALKKPCRISEHLVSIPPPVPRMRWLNRPKSVRSRAPPAHPLRGSRAPNTKRETLA